MLESVALRLLGCDEYSRPKTITFALDTLTLVVHPDKPKSKKLIEEDLKHLVPVRRALMSIPTLKHCNIRSHAKPQDVPAMYFPLNEAIEHPHFQVGQHVWCLHGGWGYWPATVFAIEDTCLEILLCWGDMTQVTFAEAPSHVFPFMEYLSKYSIMSTNQQEGFHEGVEKTLSEIARKLPKTFKEDFAIRPRERFAARMLRIASVFESYVNSLKRFHIFHNLDKEIQRRNAKIAKEIEDEEKRIIAEQRRKEREEKEAEKAMLRLQKEIDEKIKRDQQAEEKARKEEEKQRIDEEKLRIKIYNAIHNSSGSEIPTNLVQQPLRKNVIPLKHMLRNLEKESRNLPNRKRKCSVIKDYKGVKINGDHPSQSSRRRVNTKKKENDNCKDGRKNDIGNGEESPLTLLESIEVFHMEFALQQEKKVDRGVQIYAPIYDMLMSGTYTDDESLAYSIKNALPFKLLKMLVYKYFPLDVYKMKRGRTLIHLAAQYDYYNVINLLCERWETLLEITTDHIMNNVSNIAMIKDSHGRTAVHIACEYGSLKSLKALQRQECDLFERDKFGYTPLMWCASKDSPKCAFYLIENGADVTQEDRKGRSTLWHALMGDSILLGKTLFQNGCWMRGYGLQEFVADMSLGREPHKIMFDSRPMNECKEYYLNMVDNNKEAKSDNDSCVSLSPKNRECRTVSPPGNSHSIELMGYDDDEDDEDDETERRPKRCSSRVENMSTETCDEVLAVESSQWSISDFMAEVCITSPHLIPKFVYSTRSYLGELQHPPTTTKSSYECCDCDGDCTLNPDCACIMRNGQRSPYSREGLFDFTKGKIFECGDKCSCKDSCKLRMTQRGVAYPLVVCNAGGKGHGVMTTKVILKGSFVCAYVGEGVSENDLQEQEEEKIRNMKRKKKFVTYAFEIHEGHETFNVDSEYVGNVARFFNHSCDPNLRPVKVVAASKQKRPHMCFFALRRIEAGEELTWKYVTGVSLKKGGQACYCGSSNCSGYV